MSKHAPYVRINRGSDQARRLWEVRRLHQLTFRELALKLGRPESYASALCRMETGERRVPNALMRQLAGIYDVRPETMRIPRQFEFDLITAITAPAQIEIEMDSLMDASREEKQELIRYLGFLRLKQTSANK